MDGLKNCQIQNYNVIVNQIILQCHSKSNNPTNTHDCISDNIIINLWPFKNQIISSTIKQQIDWCL